MREFTVTIDRTVKQLHTITIKAKTKKEAYDVAMDIAVENEGWDGKEYDTDYEINIEEVPNNYIDRNGNPYDSEDENLVGPQVVVCTRTASSTLMPSVLTISILWRTRIR